MRVPVYVCVLCVCVNTSRFGICARPHVLVFLSYSLLLATARRCVRGKGARIMSARVPVGEREVIRRQWEVEGEREREHLVTNLSKSSGALRFMRYIAQRSRDNVAACIVRVAREYPDDSEMDGQTLTARSTLPRFFGMDKDCVSELASAF